MKVRYKFATALLAGGVALWSASGPMARPAAARQAQATARSKPGRPLPPDGTHALLLLPEQNVVLPGKLAIEGTLFIKQPNRPQDPTDPEVVVNDVVVTIATEDGHVLVNEKIAAFVNVEGAGHFSRLFVATYDFQPGTYVVMMTVHNPNRRIRMRDGRQLAHVLTAAGRKMRVR